MQVRLIIMIIIIIIMVVVVVVVVVVGIHLPRAGNDGYIRIDW